MLGVEAARGNISCAPFGKCRCRSSNETAVAASAMSLEETAFTVARLLRLHCCAPISMRALCLVSCLVLLWQRCHAIRTLSNTEECVPVSSSAQVLSLLDSSSARPLSICLERCAFPSQSRVAWKRCDARTADQPSVWDYVSSM